MNIAQNWRLNGQRYALKGVKCESCGAALFPPREVCPHCQVQQPQLFTFSKPVSQPAFILLSEAPELRQAAR